MCVVSLVTSGLALGQIFTNLAQGSRVIVLCTAENVLLRICFVAIIILIGIRDLQQIAINLFVRVSGAMMSANKSRTVMVEFFLRVMISILAMLTILVVIFTTPKGEYECVID